MLRKSQWAAGVSLVLCIPVFFWPGLGNDRIVWFAAWAVVAYKLHKWGDAADEADEEETARVLNFEHVIGQIPVRLEAIEELLVEIRDAQEESKS